jgi:hypothetical protein
VSVIVPKQSIAGPIRIAVRVAALLFVQVAGLTGCGGVGNLAPEPSPGASLAGVWRLNPAASDDSRKVLEGFRLRSSGASSTTERPARRSRRDGRDPSQGSGQAGSSTPEESYPDELPMRRSALGLVPNSDQFRNEVLAIKQAPDAFVLDYGTSVRRLTPGGHSVVSVPGGVGDQSTGWRGKEYVVEIRSQIGLDVIERYSLSDKNGKQLVVKVHLSGPGLPTVNLTRVYDPAGNAAPRSFPSID